MDNKRLDGTTLLPLAKGKPLAWDITVLDTESHIADTVSTPVAASHQAAKHKITKYSKLASTHIAIETAGAWDHMAIELVQEIGSRPTTVIAQDTRETVFLFQRLSIALQRRNAVSFLSRIIPNEKPLQPLFYTCALCWWANNNNKLVRPRWPYDMRPSVRAEKYMCVIVIR